MPDLKENENKDLDEKEEKTEDELKVEKEAEIAKKLSNLEKRVQSSDVLAEVLADPDVRQLLEAKQKGEDVRVVLGKEEKSVVFKPFEVDDDIDFDSLSNKELMKHTLKQFTKSLDSMLSSKLEPISKTIKTFESYIGDTEEKTVKKQIKAAKGKYTDFNDYVPVMQELNKVNPNLSVEELYLISKRRQAEIESEAQGVSSEKPTSSSVKALAKKRSKPLPTGRQGFSQLISEALDNLEITTE